MLRIHNYVFQLFLKAKLKFVFLVWGFIFSQSKNESKFKKSAKITSPKILLTGY